jgi:hypothetical protein
LRDVLAEVDGLAARGRYETAARLRDHAATAIDVLWRGQRLRALVAVEEPVQAAPLALCGDRVYAALPGFRDGTGHPDEWYDVTDRWIRKRVKQEVDVRRPRLDGHTLTVSGPVPFTPDSAAHLRLSLVRLPGKVVPKAQKAPRGEEDPGVDFPVTLTARGPGEPVVLRAEVDLRTLLDDDAPDGTRWAVRVRADAGAWTHDVPVLYSRAPQPTEVSQGRRRAALTVSHGKRGYLYVQRENLPPEVARRALRRALKS